MVSRRGNLNIHESKTVWNYSLSPGWTKEEVDVLKILLMKFGVGKWTSIYKSECLPSKTIQQCYLQTQRLVGQQSLAPMMGLHLDLEQIYIDNSKKQGLHKFGCIINEGDKLTPEGRKQKQAEY